MDALQKLRFLARAPIIIHSAYRCPEHNANVGGVPGSTHTLGLAADFSCPHLNLLRLLELVSWIPLFAAGGIGFYPARRYIHADIRERQARW